MVKMLMMRAYISAVKASSDAQANQPEIKAWIEWATEKLSSLESQLLKPELVELDSIKTHSYW